MDLSAIEKALKQAEKDRDLTAVEKALHNANSSDTKNAILSTLFGFDEQFPDLKFTPSENFQNDDLFKRNLIKLVGQLRSKDPDISTFFKANWRKMYGTLCRDEKIGSGVEGRWLDHYFCSNGNTDAKIVCRNKGYLRCSECGLAAYCSKSCQKEHWKFHKKICRDFFLKSDRWTPRWQLAGKRNPIFMDKSCNQAKSMLEVRIWGNIPAFDSIGFKLNERKNNSTWQKPLNLAFVASGDIRSVVETLASIPDDYQQPITIVLNDANPIVVARNLFMLSTLLFRGEAALDMVIAIWYSSRVAQNQNTSICLSYLPFNSISSTNQLKQGLSSIELNQLDDVLETLDSLVTYRKELNDMNILHEKDGIMFNPSHKDCIDLTLLRLQDYHRMSFIEFLDSGVLQPCNQDSLYFAKTAVNRFMLGPDLKWLIDDTCDPKQGWSMLEVMKFGDEKKLPRNDLYGRLFFYIRDRLGKMVSTMRRLPVTFRMFQRDPKLLANKLQFVKFDRIDLSNGTDEGDHSIDKMLNTWGPLLNNDNPNSAIVTLSRDWLPFPRKTPKVPPILKTPQLYSRMVSLNRLNRDNMEQMSSRASQFLINDSISSFSDYSQEFDKYMEKIEEKKPDYLQRRMEHTIVPHKVMFPIDTKPRKTIESLPEHDQYYVFNCTANPTDRYSEWTLVEK